MRPADKSLSQQSAVRFCLVAFSLATMTLHSAPVFADSGDWRLDGFYIGQPLKETKLSWQASLFGLFEWRDSEQPTDILHPTTLDGDEVLGILQISGRRLTLAGRPLIQSGDPPEKVLELLGYPDSDSGLFGWCREDPWIQWHYRRDGQVISVIVPHEPHEPHEPAGPKVADGGNQICGIRLRHQAALDLWQDQMHRSNSRQRFLGH